MLGFARFDRKQRWLVIASVIYFFFEAAIFLPGWFPLLRDHKVITEAPGKLAVDVNALGGPCMAVKHHEYAKYGSVGVGACNVRYTNASNTAALVTLLFFRRNSWTVITADVVTDASPLASLKWRVLRSVERSPYDLQS
jgi:hypothetical protein